MQARAITRSVELRNVLGLSLICVGILARSPVWKDRTGGVPSPFQSPVGFLPTPYPDLLPHRNYDPFDGERLVERLPPASIPSPTPAASSRVVTGESKVLPKETLPKILARMGLSMSSVREITGALKKEKMTLKAGQKITYTLEHQGESVLLQRLFLSTEFGQGMGIERLKDGSYRLKKTSLPLVVTTHCVRGVVRTNFSADAIRSGLPKDIANSVPSAFGSLVDFKRGLCPGDRFEVFFDRVSVKGSKERKSGKLLHASVVTGGAKVAVYRSPTQEGNCFYTDNAESVRRGGSFALPVVGARKTSGFGVRRHPILGRRRLHRGVDFSAPRGTPVLCSADGTVERVVSERGYGRCILVRHRGGYETFYAHLSKVGRGVCPGMHVKGGQAIGSVGSSGSATGSHLHYEVRLCGKPIDPASVRALAPQRLSGKELRKFKEFKRFADSSVRHIST